MLQAEQNWKKKIDRILIIMVEDELLKKVKELGIDGIRIEFI